MMQIKWSSSVLLLCLARSSELVNHLSLSWTTHRQHSTREIEYKARARDTDKFTRVYFACTHMKNGMSRELRCEKFNSPDWWYRLWQLLVRSNDCCLNNRLPATRQARQKTFSTGNKNPPGDREKQDRRKLLVERQARGRERDNVENLASSQWLNRQVICFSFTKYHALPT